MFVSKGGPDKQMKLYINGASVTNFILDYDHMYLSNDLYIGCNGPSDNSTNYGAAIQHLRIFYGSNLTE